MQHLCALRGALGRRRSWLLMRRYSLQSSAAEEKTADDALAVPEVKLDVIYAVPRDPAETGTKSCKKMRRFGRIPSIVFSQEDGHLGGHKQLLVLNEVQLNHLLRKFGHSFFMSKLYTLEVRTVLNPKQGEVISRERVLPRLLHVHAVSDRVLNVTFIRAPQHARLRVDIPLVFIGQDICPGIRKGGYLNTIRRTVQYYGAPDLIPKFIEVDLSELQPGGVVRIKELNVPAGLVVYAMDPSWPVCKIVGGRSSRGPPPS